MTWKLGPVGHFGLSVHDPKASARWWVERLGMRVAFEYEGGIAIENESVTIVLHPGRPAPSALGHMSFHLRSMRELRAARDDLKALGVALEDPGDEIGPEAPGSPHMGLWFRDPDGYRWELSVQNGAGARE